MVPHYLMIGWPLKMLLWNSYCWPWWHLPHHDAFATTPAFRRQKQRMLWILDQPGSHSELQVNTALSRRPFSSHKQTTNTNSYFDFIFYFSLPEMRNTSIYVLGKDLLGSRVVQSFLCFSSSAETLRNMIDAGRIWDIFWNISLIADWLITSKNPISLSLVLKILQLFSPLAVPWWGCFNTRGPQVTPCGPGYWLLCKDHSMSAVVLHDSVPLFKVKCGCECRTCPLS